MNSYSRPRQPALSRHPSPSPSLSSTAVSPRNWSLPQPQAQAHAQAHAQAQVYHQTLSRASIRLPSRASSRASSRGSSRRSSHSLRLGANSQYPPSGSAHCSKGGRSTRSLALQPPRALESPVPPPLVRPRRAGGVKRWDGNQRTTTDWDSIRRDPELWFAGGDCIIHLHAQGQSRRGPSLRLVLADIEESNCRPLLEYACAFPVPDSPAMVWDSGFEDQFPHPRYELFLPAPPHLNRDAAFAYHLTTRNFFAWMFEKPLVGSKLGDALVMVLERMHGWRPDADENQDDLLAYVDIMGYTDFRECPDHALAVLHFAETFHYDELWTDAFVHSVGMNSLLVQSQEFMAISRTTKALITRAKLEMDVRLERAGASLANFLEDEPTLNSPNLSLDAQKHTERFRSFLTSFFVQRHGYWPPIAFSKKTSALPKAILRTLFFDFRNLYDYLVDSNPVDPPAAVPTADVPLLHHVVAFDHRHKYAPLPHCLPLIPDLPDASHYLSSPARSAPRTFTLFPKRNARVQQRRAILGALTAATNSHDPMVMECDFVKAYGRFEREWTLESTERTPLSSTEARKLRWLLIYDVLQILISVAGAPTEVRDTEDVSYHLCCQTAGRPPWAFVTPPPAVSDLSLLRGGYESRIGRGGKSLPAPDAASIPSFSKSTISLRSLPSIPSSKSIAPSIEAPIPSTRSRSRSILSRLIPMSSASSIISSVTTAPRIPPKRSTTSIRQGNPPPALSLPPRKSFSSQHSVPPTPTFSIRTNTTAPSDAGRTFPWRRAGSPLGKDGDGHECVDRESGVLTPSLLDNACDGPGPSLSAADVTAANVAKIGDDEDFISWLGHRVEGEMSLERVGGKLTMVPKSRMPKPTFNKRIEEDDPPALPDVSHEQTTTYIAPPTILPGAGNVSRSVPSSLPPPPPKSKPYLRGRTSTRNIKAAAAQPLLSPIPQPKTKLAPKSAEGMERLHHLGVARRERRQGTRRPSIWALDPAADSDMECDAALRKPKRTSRRTSRWLARYEAPSNVLLSLLDVEVGDVELGDGGLDQRIAHRGHHALAVEVHTGAGFRKQNRPLERLVQGSGFPIR